MRAPHKLLIAFAAVLALLLVTLVALPFLFRDRIAARLRAQVDRSVDARVTWGGIGLSLLRDFPNATLTVARPTVVGLAPFAGDTLLTARHARLVLDLGSVVRHLRGGSSIVVREVALESPDARLQVLPDGRASWDIARDTPGRRDAGRPVAVTLRQLRVRDGRVALDDRQAKLSVLVAGLEEELRGDFARERFTLATRTRADTVSVRFAGIPYLERVGMDLNAEMEADLPANRYTIREGSLRLNALVLRVAGSVVTGSPDLGVDLRFATAGTAFRDIVSLVPAIYARDFEELQTSGTMSVAAQVRGRYGPDAFPALAVRAKVENGAFRYPSLPLAARAIAMELDIDNPGGHVDRTVVHLRRLQGMIGSRPMAARLVMRTPVSDPDVDLRVQGSVDLADLARTVKLEGVRELAGIVAADAAVRARLSDLDARRYDRVAAAGSVNVGRLSLRTDSLPHPVRVDTAALRLTPRAAELTRFAARVGRSDVRATGALDNILGFALRDDALRGRATLRSSHLDLDEWRSEEEGSVIPVPRRVDLAIEAAADRVTYTGLALADVRGSVRVRDERATLDELRMEMLRGTVVASGFYDTSVPGRPAFDLDLRLAAVDIPSAFASLTTVQQLAPVARWTQGTVSGTVGLRGPLQSDMMPVLTALTGSGTIETDRLVIREAPVLGRLADALSLEPLRNPSLGTVRASFDVVDGRLRMKPFTAALAGIAMTVAGSNGIDQSLDYTLGIAAPRTLFGGGLTRLASQAARAGAALGGGEVVELGAKVTGTVTDPAVRPDFATTAASVRQAAREQVAARTEAVRERADSAAEAARQRAREEADRLVAEAERQAETIRAEARELAANVQREAAARADSLEARAASPAARIAAKAATDRLRRQADEQAARIVREADARADGVVAQARRRAESLAPAQ